MESPRPHGRLTPLQLRTRAAQIPQNSLTDTTATTVTMTIHEAGTTTIVPTERTTEITPPITVIHATLALDIFYS